MTHKIYWSPLAQSLRPYIPGEQPQGQKIIKLNTNENPYPPSPLVLEAIRRVLADGAAALRLYPDPVCTALRECIAERYAVEPAQVFVGNGSDEVLAFAFGAFFDPKRRLPLLFPDITYSFYSVFADFWQLPYSQVPLLPDFSIDCTRYMHPKVPPYLGIVLANPNAPTGRALSREQILGILSQLQKRRVLIIDEAYNAFGGESMVPCVNTYPNLLTVHTLSKGSALAGLRVGFAIGDEGLIKGLYKMRDCFNSYTIDALAQAGAAAAIKDAGYYEGINAKIAATRERVSAALCAMDFTVIPSSANFIFIKHGINESVPELTEPVSAESRAAYREAHKKAKRGISGEDVFTALREQGILVRHFGRFDIKDFNRVSIGTDEDMDTFLAACKTITQKQHR
ncbi:pyridoxal phosphate-dependent aminotransferase [Breznakiellaceae bacterium SP9]